MSIIHPDGTLDQPATLLVTDNIDGHYSAIQEVKAVWTGDHFLVAVTTDTVAPDLHVLNVTRDGLLTSNVSISTRADDNIDVTLGADRFVVAFSQGAAGQLRAYAAYFGLDGSYLDPPGTVFLYGFTSSYAGQSSDIRASWSGEMFGVTMASYDWLGGYPVNSWRFWRLLPSGTNLDPGGILLSRDTSLDTIYKLIWAGGDWWLFATRNPKKFVRERIVCFCGDADGDGFNQCSQFDCDDSDPSTHPGATEVCRGLKDEDCDGLVDCDDPDCPGGPGPADVTDLKWSGKTSLVWSAVTGAQRYDLARGLISDVRRRKDLLLGDCSGQELVQNTWSDDGRNPPPGDALWYLVRTEGTPCALGSWGEATMPRQVSACR